MELSQGADFRMVAIGGPVGNQSAIKELLDHLVHDTHAVYFYLQQTTDSNINEIISHLGQLTKIEIEKAADGVKLQQNTLYVVNTNQDVRIIGNTIQVERPGLIRKEDHPIDRFLAMMARSHKGPIAGVVLSGTGVDGTAGLKAIKIAGGITFVQEQSAQENTVNDAIAAAAVDLVLTPAEIGEELSRISKQQDGPADAGTAISIKDSDEYLQEILLLLKKATGIDFGQYKLNTIKRRIIRRMLLYKINNLRSYCAYLKRHPNAISLLYHDLLINVTCFFRDADSMEYLRKAILPDILKSKEAGETIRIWVPACSTGEEAYSMAMLLTEMQEESGQRYSVQIFGTDLSDLVIAKARQGLYSAAELADLSESRLSKFFTPVEGNQYKVAKQIRDLCVFAQHNVFKDPPFSRLDLVSCCNFFIYLNNSLQQKCIALFYYALNPNGCLILGKSETISAASQQLFSQVEKKFKVYRKKADAGSKAISDLTYRLPALISKDIPDPKRRIAEPLPELLGIDKIIDEILHARYIPPAVLINQEMEIQQFRGSTSLFLEPPHGKATFNLMKMARPSLVFDLRNAIHEAQATQKNVRKSGIELKVKNQHHVVSFEVIPILSNNEEKLVLIIFEEQQPGGQKDFSKDETVQKLKEELNAVRNIMQAIIDEHEANKEELQSANEEIISSNEELQSINEELETSKEEVESANEELMAINAELHISNEQLLESQEYAEAIFATIREAVLVLTADFRVKLANAAFYRVFHIEPGETEGRLLYEIGKGQWNNPEIKDLINKILFHNQQFDGYEMQYQVPGIGDRVMLVNGRKLVQKANKQELMLLAFEDITDRRQAELLKAEREAWFRNIASNAPVLIWTADTTGMRNYFNVTWLTYTGKKIEHELGTGWINEINPDDKEMFLSVYYDAFEKQKPFTLDYRLRRYDGEYRWVKAVGRPTFSPDGQFTGFVGICTEIHDSRMVQEELERLVNKRTFDLQQLNKELKKSNSELEQFAYVASHDLQEPLRKIMLFSDRLSVRTLEAEKRELYISKIEDSAQRMSQLINDLLDFSRAVKNDQPFIRTDLSEILQTELENFEHVIKEKNAVVIVEEMPAVDAIPFQIRQLFHNLLGNALKFCKSDIAPVIKVSSRLLREEEIVLIEGLNKKEQYVEIVFEDNGIGFSNEYAERIFVLFQRLNRKHEFPGTGIGLALCRKIVENHGGKIFANSIESVHTEFHVILPVEQR